MAQSNFKRTYKLEQQTPLIHFQHDQDGATLRGSSVKPRLDRFILAFAEKQGIKIPRSWYVAPDRSNEIKALNYKLSFKGKNSVSKDKGIHKLYFANFRLKPDNKKFRCSIYGDAEMTIICFCEEGIEVKEHNDALPLKGNVRLLELMDFILPAFFKLNCFGLRSTKGFGSYNVVTDNELYTTEEYLHFFVPMYYTIGYDMIRKIEYKQDNSTASEKTVRQKMDCILLVSGMMKSGFNFTNCEKTGFYYKGRLFRYFSNKNIGSDKAFLKSKNKELIYSSSGIKREDGDRDYEEYRFSRAMLGLPQDYVYRFPSNNKITVCVAHKGAKIERFASPVHFIPNENEILILPVEIPDCMFDAEFSFIIKNKTENRCKIKTPSHEQFDLTEYLDWFMEQFNTQVDIPSKLCESILEPIIRARLKIERHPVITSAKGGEEI